MGVKPLQEFHADPAYAGDLHRADMAWTRHAAGRQRREKLTIFEVNHFESAKLGAIKKRKGWAKSEYQGPSTLN